MTEENESEATRTKLSPPAEREAASASDVRFQELTDDNDWRRVKKGLGIIALAQMLIACTCGVGVVLFSPLLLIGGFYCKDAPSNSLSGRRMRWCLSCHLLWFSILAVFLLQSEFGLLGMAFGQSVLSFIYGEPTIRAALRIVGTLLAMAGTLFWLLFLADVTAEIGRPTMRIVFRWYAWPTAMVSILLGALFFVNLLSEQHAILAIFALSLATLFFLVALL
jgi:hypothetical protein